MEEAEGRKVGPVTVSKIYGLLCFVGEHGFASFDQITIIQVRITYRENYFSIETIYFLRFLIKYFFST